MKSICQFNIYRAVLLNLVSRNLKIRYRGSLLGFLWGFLHPLLTMGVLYIVFSYIARIQIEQYPLFLLTGLVPWVFFSNSLTDATRSLIDNASLVKKVYFPREILPISYVISNFINLLFSLVVLLLILIIFRAGGLRFIYFLPVVLIIHLLFTIGIALILSSTNVFFRDVGHLLAVLLMCWFYLTPIFYPLSMVPQKFYNIYILNPTVLIISIYRNILFSGRSPSLANISIALLLVTVVFFLGYFIFKKLSPSFAKEL